MTQEEFIKRAKVYHPELDYSKVEFQGVYTPVTLICSIHGQFSHLPKQILYKDHTGCPNCGKRKTSQQVMEDIKKQFPDLDFSKSKYICYNKPIDVVCSKHGAFSITPFKLKLRKYGCPDCGNENKGNGSRRLESQKPKKNKDLNKHKGLRKDTKTFIMQSMVYFPEYNYSRVVYTGNRDAVEVICPKHGVFFQKPICLLTGHGCPKCGWERGKEKRTHKEVKNVQTKR